MDINFNQARSKHTFFRTRVRGYLLGSEANTENLKAYLTELGDWVKELVVQYNLNTAEVLEANYLHNELTDKTDKLIKLWARGQEAEARQKFQEIESTGRQFLDTLSILEQQVSKKQSLPKG